MWSYGLLNLEFKGFNIKIEAHLDDAAPKEKYMYDELNSSFYISDRYVDLKKRISVTYNGKQVFNKKLKLSEAALVESTALFADPGRIFPAKIEINSNHK